MEIKFSFLHKKFFLASVKMSIENRVFLCYNIDVKTKEVQTNDLLS